MPTEIMMDAIVSARTKVATPATLTSHAQAVYQQAVVQKTMPMANATGMTDEERALLGRWFLAGAPAPK